MAERQHEVLGEGIDEAEGDLVVMVPAMDRVTLQIVQRVVHEAHVPLEAEAQPALVDGVRDLRPRRRFLGDRHDAGMRRVDGPVHLAQELDGLEVFAAALLVGDPLAFLARIVEVEHRGDRIHAQAVDMVFLGPEQRVVDEERHHLAAAEIVDRGVPVGMEALAGVLVLVERRAVEASQPVLVGRKVGGHPVEDDAEADAVRAVDEARESLGLAEARRRRVQPGRLVAPGRIVGMLHHRHELDVGEAHVDAVGDQAFGQFVPTQEAAIVAPLPGTGMNLVDRNRLAARIGVRPVRAMGAVAPLMRGCDVDDRGGRRTQFRAESERVGLERQALAARADDLVFVRPAGAYARHENFPDAGVDAATHRMAPAVPVVEVADHRHAARIRRPDREMHTVGALVRYRMRAELVEQAQMRALADVVIVHRPEHRPEGVRIDDLPRAAVIGCPVDQRAALADRQGAFEQAGLGDAMQPADRLTVERRGFHGRRTGNEAACDEPAACLLQAEDGEGIGMISGDDRVDIGAREHGLRIRSAALPPGPRQPAPPRSGDRADASPARPVMRAPARCRAHIRRWCGRTKTSRRARC